MLFREKESIGSTVYLLKETYYKELIYVTMKFDIPQDLQLAS